MLYPCQSALTSNLGAVTSTEYTALPSSISSFQPISTQCPGGEYYNGFRQDGDTKRLLVPLRSISASLLRRENPTTNARLVVLGLLPLIHRLTTATATTTTSASYRQHPLTAGLYYTRPTEAKKSSIRFQTAQVVILAHFHSCADSSLQDRFDVCPAPQPKLNIAPGRTTKPPLRPFS